VSTGQFIHTQEKKKGRKNTSCGDLKGDLKGKGVERHLSIADSGPKKEETLGRKGGKKKTRLPE